ncbi:hypothetical protein ACFL5O_11765, partial [Myxococcota bacterium]
MRTDGSRDEVSGRSQRGWDALAVAAHAGRLELPDQTSNLTELDPMMSTIAKRYLSAPLKHDGRADVLRDRLRSFRAMEPGPTVSPMVQPHLSQVDDPRLHWIEQDGRSYVRTTERRYDVVILDLPEPTTLQYNRYYTREFFREVRRILSPHGVLSFSLGQYANYLSQGLSQQLAIGYGTLLGVFVRVEMIPFSRVLFLASDGALTLEIAEQLRTHRISTQWVQSGLLEAVLAEDRTRELGRVTRLSAPTNRDFAPELQRVSLRHWLGRFHLPPAGWIGLGVGLLLAALLGLGRVPLAVASAGFA